MGVVFTIRLDSAPPVFNRLSVDDADKRETWQMRAPNDHDEVKIGVEGSMWKSPVSSLLHLASDSVLVTHGGELAGGWEGNK